MRQPVFVVVIAAVGGLASLFAMDPLSAQAAPVVGLAVMAATLLLAARRGGGHRLA